MMDVFSILLSIRILPALLFVVGIVLLLWELLIPGFGLPGITGTALLITGIVIQSGSLKEAVVWIGFLAALLVILAVLTLHSANRGLLSKSPVVLKNVLSRREGFSSTEDLQAFVGRAGVTVTVLRPAGIAVFDGARLDVVSDGAFIEKGVPVMITKVEGRCVRVIPRGESEEPSAQENGRTESEE